MSKEVLLAAFKKAGKEINSSKKTHRAKCISDFLLDEFKFSISERSLRDYYNYYDSGNYDVEKELKPVVTKNLCRYLGFENYEDFVLTNKKGTLSKEGIEIINERNLVSKIDPNQTPKELDEKKKKKKRRKFYTNIAISILVIAMFIALILNYSTLNGLLTKNENIMVCMTWKEDHYELASCPNKHNPSIIPIDEKLLNEFKKITVDTSYAFFDDNGIAKVWYDKTGGKIEFFNMSENHPTNGKKLKPITEPIIRKYVFGEE